MARRSRVGDFKLRRVLRNVNQTLDNELRPAMQAAADIVLEKQRELMPKDTGAAAAALEAFVSRSGLDAQIGIRGKAKRREFYYVRFLEFGTKAYVGNKRSGGRNRRDTNKSDGTNFFGKYPDIPARPAHPWLRPSYDLNRDEIVGLIRAAIASTLAKAAGGGNP